MPATDPPEPTPCSRARFARRRPVLCFCGLLASVTAAALLAGCGGGKPPSKADYVKKANQVCQMEKEEMDALSLAPRATVQEGIEASVQIKEKTYAKLRAIKLPESQATPAEWLRYRARAITAGNEILATKLRSSARRASNLRYFKVNQKAGKIARAYGLNACVGFAAS